jgi:RimJ/RimL family protein N-acetyltransferase
MAIPGLTTPHLTLRPLQESDAPLLHAIHQQEGVLTYFPATNPPSLAAVERYIAGQARHWQDHGYGTWAITLGGEAAIIGWAGLQFLEELDETEIGYLLAPAQWGKGYATEAAQAALRFGFEQANLDHLVALVHPQNHASQRVAEKCGLRYQETIHIWNFDLMRFSIAREAPHARSSTDRP